MLKFFYRLAGTDFDVIKRCPADTKAKYGNLVLALLLTTLLSFIGGADVARQFTENPVIIILVACLWATAVFSFDYFLINGGNVHTGFKLIRIPVGISNIAITITALLIMLNQSTIDNTLKMGSTLAVTRSDSVYLHSKDLRYADYNAGVKKIGIYHNENCLREAANGYPGPKYALLHAVCIQTNKVLDSIRKRLDSLEAGYRASWQLRHSALTSAEHNDFFAKAELLPPIIVSHPMMQFLTIALVLFLGYIELQALVLKFSVSRDDDYHQHLAVHLANEHALAQAAIQNETELKAASQKSQMEHDKVNSRMGAYLAELAGIKQDVLMEYELTKMLGILSEKGFDLTKLLEMKKRYLPGQVTEYGCNVEDDVFYMSMPMKALAVQVMADTKPEDLRMAFFDWVCDHITYDMAHDHQFCRPASWTFRNRTGICTEQAVLLIALYRFAGLAASFCAVSVDDHGHAVNHACVAYTGENGETVLADTVYRRSCAAHQSFRILTDAELTEKYRNWNI